MTHKNATIEINSRLDYNNQLVYYLPFIVASSNVRIMMSHGAVQSPLALHADEIDTVLSMLWASKPGAAVHVYAILDGARDKRLEPWLNNSQLKHECLLSGNLSYAMRRAAPHLVLLEHGHPFTRQLIAEGWGQSWGWFLVAPARCTFASVRTGLRRNGIAIAPTGKRLMFRYYDPRVLRTFLPVCSPQQAERVFGEGVRLVLEGGSPEWLQEYSLAAQKTLIKQSKRVLLAGDLTKPDSTERVYSLPSIDEGVNSTFKLSQEQITAIARIGHLATYKKVCEQFSADNELDATQYNEFYTACFQAIERFGLLTQYSMVRYLHIGLVNGADFSEQEEYAWALPILTSSQWADTKIDQVAGRLSAQLMDQLWR